MDTLVPALLPKVMISCLLIGSGLMGTNAKVIVFFGVPHASYVRAQTNVARTLAEMGHQAHVCIPQFMLTNKMTDIDGIKVIPYGEYLGNVEEVIGKPMVEAILEGQESMSMSQFFNTTNIVGGLIRSTLKDKSLMTTLKKLKPDIFVITNLPPFKNLVILPYMLGVPFAYMSPFYDIVGQRVPFSPSATACPLFTGSGKYSPGFVERLCTALCHLTLFIVPVFNDNTLLADVAPEKPQISVDEISRQAEVYIVEGDHILDYAKPELPNMKLVGCTSSRPAKPLKEPFLSFMDKSKYGVIVVTFGSGILDIPAYLSSKMTAAFKNQNLNVVWRADFPSPVPDKILTSKWVPQNDILGHPNTKLFLSHCGANGQYETLYHGVPVLCLPILNEQHYNAERSRAKGFGLTGDIVGISAEQLTDLLQEMIGNVTYTRNIQRASKLYRQLYKLPEREAAFWIDHVMEYGGSYMRSSGQEMPLYQFLVLDILAFIAVMMTLFVGFVYLLCFCCVRACRQLFSNQPRSKGTKRE